MWLEEQIRTDGSVRTSHRPNLDVRRIDGIHMWNPEAEPSTMRARNVISAIRRLFEIDQKG